MGRPILLLHGLMGSARTWSRHVSWLRAHGHVYTFDAAGHGRPIVGDPTTELFVEDLAATLSDLDGIDGPLTVIGHSMGALHAWCFAASYPDLVRALVLEDMAPDFRGRTAKDWAAMVSAWPQPFPTEESVLDYFGEVAGRYFLDSFERRPDGWYLHGEVETFRAISEEWGTRSFWTQWDAVRAPTLLIEGEFTITPEGQMRRMLEGHDAHYVWVEQAGHLVHDDQPVRYRAAVEEFLKSLE